MKFFKDRSKIRRGGLAENTIMLSIMSFSTLFLGFFTSGYQTQVLGDENYGFLALVIFVMNFFQLFLDFGFVQSAPSKIAKRQDDKPFLSKMLTSVTIIKLSFTVISAIVLFILLSFQNLTFTQNLTYWFSLLQVASNSMLPDYMYRGLEKMSVITARAVLIKLFSVVMLIIFVTEPEHFYLVPLLTAVGNIGAMVFVYYHLFNKMKIPFCKVSRKDVVEIGKDSSRFFFSRIATTVYTSVNGLILGGDSNAETGYYKNANMVMEAAKSGLISPVADSLYPNLVRTRNFSMVKKIMKVFYPIMIAGCTVVFIFAEPLLTIWLKESAQNVVLPLRALMPTVIIAVPSYILGFPTLGAMGLTKQVNNSTIFGTIIHVLMLGTAYFTGNINMLTLCIMTCITELLILIYRIVVVYKNRHLMKEPLKVSDDSTILQSDDISDKAD